MRVAKEQQSALAAAGSPRHRRGLRRVGGRVSLRGPETRPIGRDAGCFSPRPGCPSMNRFAAVAAILLSTLATPLAIAADLEVNVPMLPIGAQAPDFDLEGVDGKHHALKDYAAARALLVVFTCNHCPTAQAYESRLKAIAADYQSKGVAMVAISPNDPDAVRLDELGYTDLTDSLDDMKIRARDAQFNFPYLFDGDKHGVARAYGPNATPVAFVFDRDRALRYVGRIDDSERESLVKVHDVRDALDALLAGKEVPAVTQARAFGCSTKWSDKEQLARDHLAKLDAEPVSVTEADAETLKSLRKGDGKNLRLINVWATWCGPCVAEMPDLVAINRWYRQRPFETVTVAANFPDEKAEVLDLLKAKHASGRNLLFGDKDKYKMMEALDPSWNGTLPYTLLVSGDGKVLYKATGPFDPLALKRAIVKGLATPH